VRGELNQSQYDEALARAERWTPLPGLSGSDNRPTLIYVQHSLNGLGIPAGHPDGVMGPSTRNAIDRFRRTQGLTNDDLEAVIQELRKRTPALE
jgi:peptidoglycan hydrolase-like protein with peptidoglycan-binding domain